MRFMSSGKTSPALCGCENENGEMVGEYVVKLKGAIGDAGSLSEFVCSQLASYFHLTVPAPALVTMEDALIEQIALTVPDKSSLLASSVGINFGTKVVVGGATWPVDKGIPEILLKTAAEIFAFDALTQNPDRRYDNTNILTAGDSIVLIDHESSFSFLFVVFPSATPWLMGEQAYLANHVFFRVLKSKAIDLGEFTELLSGLSDEQIDRLVTEVPNQWKNEKWERIRLHLCAMREHCEEFAEEIRRFLV
jgi:hypothetical protein